ECDFQVSQCVFHGPLDSGVDLVRVHTLLGGDLVQRTLNGRQPGSQVGMLGAAVRHGCGGVPDHAPNRHVVTVGVRLEGPVHRIPSVEHVVCHAPGGVQGVGAVADERVQGCGLPVALGGVAADADLPVEDGPDGVFEVFLCCHVKPVLLGGWGCGAACWCSVEDLLCAGVHVGYLADLGVTGADLPA